MIKNVAFFGWSEAKPQSSLFQEAKATAALLAKNGFHLINGGGPGVMLATTLGAQQSGGRVTTVTFNPRHMDFFEGRDPQNQADENFQMDTYEDRTEKLISLGDAFIIFNGGTGTISELGMVWSLARLFYKKHKPLLFYGNFWYEILETIARNMKLREEELKVYRVVNSPQQVLASLQTINKKRRS